MKKKVIVGGLFVSLLFLGACQKSNTDTTSKSTKQTNSIVKKASSSSTAASTTSSSSEKQSNDVKDSSNSDPNIISTAQQQLVGKRFSIIPVLYDGEDAAQAMAENKAPQNLIHDGATTFSFTNDSTVHVELLGTYRPDYDTSYTLTDNMIIIQQRNIPYSVKNGIVSFDDWTTDLDGHTVTWSFAPEENSSETSVDTKNLTSEQFKEWVSAVLDKQFSMGRSSFPYDLITENNNGYAYVRVKHSEMQVDTITMFRINDEGQLEEEDKSNGYPVTYKVVSTKFMDTSDVTVVQ